MFGEIKTKLLLILAKETPNVGSKQTSSIAQSHYCISNDVKAKLSRKFHGEMTLFASAFTKPVKIRFFLFDKPIKCFAFLFTFRFYVCFSRSYESRSIVRFSCML